MRLDQLETPATLVDLDILESNINNFQNALDAPKELWPMLKTHKSSAIALMQRDAGASGFLCGTLDECEALLRLGLQNIMYAYPIASEPNITRAINLAKACNFFVRLDTIASANILNDAAQQANVKLNYTVIIDTGLNRFGIRPQDIKQFLEEMSQFQNLNFRGISTHPGHVYGCSDQKCVEKIAKEECDKMAEAYNIIKEMGLNADFISSGSNPTFMHVTKDPIINKHHPGAYVFMDNNQVMLGAATEKDCALTVLATIVANPREGVFLMDAGVKCLCLDKGAHGTETMRGFGRIKGHPELLIASVSEEVGKILVEGETSLKVGDKIQIIPNHACTAANMTSFYIGHRNDVVEKVIEADIRGNSGKKGVGE